MGRLRVIIIFSVLAGFVVNTQAANVKAGLERANLWNQFAQDLHAFHKERASRLEAYTEENNGGYGGSTNDLEFYREVKYFDKKTGNLLTNIKWENQNPDNLHSIDIYIYDAQGRIAREYSAVYMPIHRKAPYQTLINMHHYKDGLHGFRQFDASDNRIFEFCAGNHYGQKIHMVLDDYEIPDEAAQLSDKSQREIYNACFSEIPTTVKPYLTPGL
jgi:hypothetical protein